MSSVTVKIFGEEFNIRSKDDAAYVQKVADYLDQKMREVAQSGGGLLPVSKIAILAAMNITDEHFRFKEGSEIQGETINRVLDELIKVLDQSLEP